VARWQVRALPDDPLDLPARSLSTPNTNDQVGSVGPNVPPAGDVSAQAGESGGYGATHVMYPAGSPPLQAQAWAGWPVEWQVPSNFTRTGAPGYGMSDIVFAAIDRNATAFGSMPVVVSKGLAPQPSPTWLTNPQPEVYTCWAEFARQLWWSYQGCGEAFLIATSRFADGGGPGGRGWPRTFMVLDPWLCTPAIVDGVRTVSVNGFDATDEVLHLRYASWPTEARGIGPLEVAGERVAAARALMRYGSDLATAGGLPWAVLKSKYRLTPGRAAELRDAWVTASRSRMGAPAILDGELDLTPMQVTPRDMALADLQTASESRIAVLLGVPPYLLGLPSAEGSSAPYQNVQAIFDYWWRATLYPHGSFMTSALSLWALAAGTNLVLDSTSYTQPGPLDRAQFYAIMLGNGVMSVDEVRAAERLAPAPAAGSAVARVEQHVGATTEG
jgi:HK97 family phage portal protein